MHFWESMATNVEEKIDASVDTEGMGTAPPTDAQNDTSDTGNDQIGSISCGTRLGKSKQTTSSLGMLV